MAVYDEIIGNIWQYSRLVAGKTRKIVDVRSATVKVLSIEVTDDATRVRININDREFLNATIADIVARGYPAAIFPGGWRISPIQEGIAAAITVQRMEIYLTAPTASDVQYAYVVLCTPVRVSST